MQKAEQDSQFKFTGRNRLISKQDFAAVFAEPQRVSSKHCLILFKKNQRVDGRLGIVIRKQHIKNAVDRNLIRRIIRESFRYHQVDLQGIDIIVLIRAECLKLCENKQILRQYVDNLWPILLDIYNKP